MVKNHVGRVGPLPRVRHRVTDRRRRWGPVVLLRQGHHVMRVGHNGLPWILSRVMVWRRGIARLGERLTRTCRIIVDRNRNEVTVLPRGNRRDSESLLSKTARRPHVSSRRLAWRRSVIIVGGRGRLTVGVMTTVRQRGWYEHMSLGQVRWGHAEALGHLRAGRMVEGVGVTAGGLACPHVSMINVGLQVSLREIGAFTALNNTTHVKRATMALFNALDWIGTAVQVDTWTHLIALSFMKQCTVITENMLAWNHTSVCFNG